jgi:hypothetical protein
MAAKKKAAESTEKAKTTGKPPATTSGADLISTGMELQYSMADFDVNDPYTFTIKDNSDGLKVHFQMGRSDEGDLTFTTGALKSARKWVSIAQGGALLPDGENASAIRSALPPFLVSRDVLVGLRQGDASVFSEWGGGEIDLHAKPEKRRVSIGGTSVELSVLHAMGDDIDFWVVDDDRWPVVLEHTEAGGDNFWKIHKAGKGLGPWSGDEDADDE